jgi:serine/threonine protein kinase/tetratricopeptide (TPR) repeat protein
LAGVTPEAITLIERLRRALGPTFRVDGEIAKGGMGSVFRAQDLSLNRPVAVKILPPEFATAERAERFRREAQILAQLSHPCIVPVYQVSSTASDLNYYIMQFLEGETLADRLLRGPLPVHEAMAMGEDLLSALGVCHRHHVIHRDVKPSNVFLVEHRAILTDFGIAKGLTGAETALTGPAQMIGTPAYMAPEQWEGNPVTEATDLYAVGLLLYESITGKRWPRSPTDPPDWSKVPRRIVQALRRALAHEPGDRWRTAEDFTRALKAANRPSTLIWAASGVAVAVIAVLAWLLWPRPDPGIIGIARFGHGPGIDSTISNDLTSFVLAQIKGAGGLHIVGSDSRSFNDVNTLIRGRVSSAGGSRIKVQLTTVRAGQEEFIAEIDGSRDSLDHLSNAVANSLMRDLLGPLHGRPLGTLSETPRANKEFAEGETTFRNVHWAEAEAHYQNAVQLDSTFALAAWRLAFVRRWRRLTPNIDLKPLLERYRSRLGELDQLLIEAELAPDPVKRFELYETAVTRYPNDAFAWLLYGDELMHRGPLAGYYLTDALNKFHTALAYDSTLAAAWFHIGWIHIRMGDEAGARRALENQVRLLPSGDAGVGVDLTLFLQLAYAERFAPDKAPPPGTFSPAQLQDVVNVFRWAISVDIPEGQLKYGRLVDSMVPLAPVQASAHDGQAIALVALGRPLEALQHFDRAQVLRVSAEADLHRAQWRVIPAAMGWYAVPPAEIDQGRRVLTTMLATDSLAGRAAWALALDAAANADWQRFSGYYRLVSGRRRDPVAGRLKILLDADTLGRSGRYAEALALSNPILAFDSAGRVGDPFARAVLRLERGTWLEKSNQLMDADRELAWYENSDLAGSPIGEIQPIEVDWSLANIARLRRARLNLATGHLIEGCGYLRRVAELWARGEAQFRVQADSARAQVARSPCTT